jgi:hypothetical protein
MQNLLAAMRNLWFHISYYVPPSSAPQKEIAMGVTAYRGLAAQFPATDPQQRRVEPFRSAEDAWLWTMAALVARREGARYIESGSASAAVRA